MFYIVFFVPVDHAEKVKEAMFESGAGTFGNYSHCSFETKGRGQFKPLNGSNPFIGKANLLETVEELRVEMMCLEEKVPSVLKALKASHPYEEPAYYVIKTVSY